MKFTYVLVVSMFIFSSCEKEEIDDQSDNIPSFSWKITGDDYTDNLPVIVVNSSDVLTIDASDNSVNIRLIIYNFSSLSNGSEISLNNLTDKAYVTYNGVEHTDTQNGNFTLSKITESKLSGTFNFTSRELVSFQSITVTDGQFSNIIY